MRGPNDPLNVEGYIIGDRLRGILSDRKVSHKSLAEELGLHSSVISLWMRNHRPITQTRFEQLLGYLGMTECEFFETGYNEPPPQFKTVPTGRPKVGWFETWITTKPEKPQGVDRLSDAPVYEVYCLLCGRGLGHDGVLIDTNLLPKGIRRLQCATCGGMMLVERVPDSSIERLMKQKHSYIDATELAA